MKYHAWLTVFFLFIQLSSYAEDIVIPRPQFTRFYLEDIQSLAMRAGWGGGMKLGNKYYSNRTQGVELSFSGSYQVESSGGSPNGQIIKLPKAGIVFPITSADLSEKCVAMLQNYIALIETQRNTDDLRKLLLKNSVTTNPLATTRHYFNLVFQRAGLPEGSRENSNPYFGADSLLDCGTYRNGPN